MDHYYAMTISPFYNIPNIGMVEIEKVITEYALREPMNVHEKVYELEHGKLHVHMLVSMRNNVYKKRLRHRGFSTRIDSLPTFLDKVRWENYIFKCVHPDYKNNINEHNIVTAQDHYYYHNYGFGRSAVSSSPSCKDERTQRAKRT